MKKKTTDDGEPMDFDDAATALAALAQELEDAEDIPEPLEDNEIDDENLETGDDDDDGLGDERKGMSDEEAADLDKNIVPIRLMLTKVR